MCSQIWNVLILLLDHNTSWAKHVMEKHMLSVQTGFLSSQNMPLDRQMTCLLTKIICRLAYLPLPPHPEGPCSPRHETQVNGSTQGCCLTGARSPEAPKFCVGATKFWNEEPTRAPNPGRLTNDSLTFVTITFVQIWFPFSAL